MPPSFDLAIAASRLRLQEHRICPHFCTPAWPEWLSESGQEYALLALIERADCCALPPFKHDAESGQYGLTADLRCECTS